MDQGCIFNTMRITFLLTILITHCLVQADKFVGKGLKCHYL